MPYYKDLNGGLHFIEASAFENLLPEGSVQISDDEAKALQDSYVPPAPLPPKSVSMRQARLALLNAGLLAAVESAVAGMEGGTGAAAKIEWEYATEIRRDNPLFESLSAQLGLTAAQIDQLFTMAATL
jgi:hypothetical protein